MGALPSRETYNRGLYTHRHGRNRRNEVILIPLTKDFFPSAESPIFQRLHQSRNHRTAKYYFRRSVPDTEPVSEDHIIPPSFSDSPEGLYRVLVEDNDVCVYDTDEQLREAYYAQIKQQTHLRAAADEALHVSIDPPVDPFAAAVLKAVEEQFEVESLKVAPAEYAPPANPLDSNDAQMVRDRATYQRIRRQQKQVLRGQLDASVLEQSVAEALNQINNRYAPVYTSPTAHLGNRVVDDPETNKKSVPIDLGNYLRGIPKHKATNAGGEHVTSPSAYAIRPIPVAIAARYDPNRHTKEQIVEFAGVPIVVLGMFGLFPHTEYPKEAGAIPQHMLKGTMFVDRDVGDQILGTVVLLGAHMYVRHCLDCSLRPHRIPMLPIIIRVPLSNIPMLQFIREMRFRLRVLLESGMQEGVNDEDDMITSTGSNVSAAYNESGDILRDADYNSLGWLMAFIRPGMQGGAGGSDVDSGQGNTSNSNKEKKKRNSPTAPQPPQQPRGMTMLSHGFPYYNICSSRAADYLYEEDNNTASVPSHLISPNNNANILPPYVPHDNTSDTSIPFLLMSGYNVQSTSVVHPQLLFAGLRWPRVQEYLPQRFDRLKTRYRTCVEDGHLVIYSSAAFARRGCLLLAQQLNTTVDSADLPEQRSWNYRGLLRQGMVVPTPEKKNDVVIASADFPDHGLYRGDVLRASTEEEVARAAAIAAGKDLRRMTPEQLAKLTTNYRSGTTTTNNNNNNNNNNKGTAAKAQSSASPPTGTPTTANGGTVNLTSNHSSNPLLRDPGKAPDGAFWVRGAGELFIPPGLAERNEAAVHALKAAHRALNGSLNIEEVLLSWIKVVSIQTRDASETDAAWVKDADGQTMRRDQYVIRRFSHDGIRYFIGVTPKFVGQQRRLEKVLADETVVERLNEEERALAEQEQEEREMFLDIADLKFEIE